MGEQNKNTIPGFWGRAKSDGTINTLLRYASDKTFIYGTCYGNGHSNSEVFDYGIAVECAPDTVAPEGFRVNTIPARKWLVAECTGAMPDAIQQLWHELCAEFFPNLGLHSHLRNGHRGLPRRRYDFARLQEPDMDTCCK